MDRKNSGITFKNSVIGQEKRKNQEKERKPKKR
jgi:hypothetical protein